jgi:hypothetical protein
MTRVTHVRIYVSPRRRNFVRGVAHTIKIIPPDETPEGRWRSAMGKVFVGTDMAEEG